MVGGSPQMTGRENFHKRARATRVKLIQYPERSNSWIAEDCGLNDDTVSKLRRRLEASSEIPKLIQFQGRDGKYYCRGYRGRKKKCGEPGGKENNI